MYKSTTTALVSLALAATSSCAALSSVGGAPTPLAGGANVQLVDFEQAQLHEPPEGFEARAGRWTVADSPTAVSGTQVIVRGGQTAGLLLVKDAEGVTAAGGEVSVRVFLGSSGAGISCHAPQKKTGYLVKVEPNEGRIALYREADDSVTLVDHASVSTPKGEWGRLGIRCERERIIGYLDGKPLVKHRAGVSSFDLALYAGPGVTAQFDDLKFWAIR